MDFDTQIKPILAGQIRHLATIAATALAAHGYLASDRTDAFVSAGSAALLLLAAMGWSAAQKWLSQNRQARQLAGAYAAVPPDVQAQLDNMAKLVAASPKAAAIIHGESPVP